jgi:hypothetical protein
MFETVLASVLNFFGISTFAKNTEGKSALTDEQKTKLTQKWGEKFVTEFEKDLIAYETDGKKADGEATKEAMKKLEQDKVKLAGELKTAQDKLVALETEEKKLKAIIAKLEGEETPDSGKKIEGEEKKMGKAYKPDMTLRHNKYIETMAMGKPSASFDGESINTAELQAEFGKYVEQTTEIFRSLLGTTDSLKYMTTMITDKFEIKASHAHISSVLQSFTPQWTAKGNAKFTPLVIKQYPMKINVEIIPSDVMDEVIGYLYDENLDPKDMPIVKYIVEKLVRPKLDEERETAFAIGGYKEPQREESGKWLPNAADEVCDGYLTILCQIKRDGNTKGVNFIFDGNALGTGDQLVTNIEQAVDEVAVNYKNKKMFIHCDPNIVLNYSRAYRDRYKNTKNEDGEKIKVDYTNFTFGPCEGMRGTGAFFITPKENFRHLMSRNPRDQKLRMATQDYTAKIYGEWREGIGFWLAEAVFAYIPDALLNELVPEGI